MDAGGATACDRGRGSAFRSGASRRVSQQGFRRCYTIFARHRKENARRKIEPKKNEQTFLDMTRKEHDSQFGEKKYFREIFVFSGKNKIFGKILDFREIIKLKRE